MSETIEVGCEDAGCGCLFRYGNNGSFAVLKECTYHEEQRKRKKPTDAQIVMRIINLLLLLPAEMRGRLLRAAAALYPGDSR